MNAERAIKLEALGVDSRSDEDLLEASVGGNVEAFEAIYLRYRDWVARVAGRMCGDGGKGVELVRRIFLRFVEEFPGIGQFARVRPVLYRMARGMAMDVIREMKRDRPEEAARAQGMSARREGSGGGDAGEDVPGGSRKEGDERSARQGSGEGDVRLARLAEAVNGLSVGQREVLLMSVVDGMSEAEIAEALEISEASAGSRLERAMSGLRGDGRVREYFSA